MSRPTIRIHDLETNEIIDREMTAAELKIYEANQAETIAKENAAKAEFEARAAAKQAILDRLGLTADEAKLLLG